MKKLASSKQSGSTRREFLSLAGQSVLFLSAAQLMDLGAFLPLAKAWGTEFKGTRDVNVGIMAPSHCAAPYVYSEVKEIYGKHDIKANLVYYQNMADIAGDLIADKIQFGQLILPLFLAVHLKAGPFKDKGISLVTTQATGINGGAITVRKDSAINTIEDLAGKKVGSHSMLTTHYLLMSMFIQKNKLTMKEPIKLEIIPLEKMIPSLESGEIDAFIMPEPTNAVAAGKGIGRVIFLTSKLWPNHPCCMLSSSRAFAQQNPGTARAMSLSLAEACLFAQAPENRQTFIDVIQKNAAYQKLPRPVLEGAMEPGRSDFFPFPFKSSARVVGDYMKTMTILPEKVTAEDIVGGFDTGTVREALKVAGQDKLPDYRPEKVLFEEIKYT